MFEAIDMSLVDWSRAQFALTALYHRIFVPLTLGIIFIIAIMEGIYVKTNDEKWAKTVKFWMKLMWINFAIWVATWIILEFEFGTNWSNYSWFVWDIFWAPLAIEWLMAFFMESVFIALMFWGWWKLSKKAHLRVTWITAIWTNLSAIWILTANAWMQYPVWMKFNPDLMRNEMVNFWDVLFSPIAMNKFLHVVSTSYMYAAAFIIMVWSYYLIKNRDKDFAKKSILIASIFGFLASILAWVTWDIHAKEIAKHQPMKLAVMEALYDWWNNVWLKTWIPWVEIPWALSFLAFWDFNAYVPWINDLLTKGYTDNDWVYQKPYTQRIIEWQKAIKALREYKEHQKAWTLTDAKKEELKPLFLDKDWMLNRDFGFGYFENTEEGLQELVPHVGIMFYTFRIMAWVWTALPFIFLLIAFFTYKNRIEDKKCLLKIWMLSFFLAFLGQELGRVVAELGRQPWTVQNMLPTKMSSSHLSVRSVQVTFFLFLFIFTALIIAEFKIMIAAIQKGPDWE